MLTEKRKAILEFCVQFYKTKDNLPTARLIATQFGFWQTAAQEHVQKLIRDGFLIQETLKSGSGVVQKLLRFNRANDEVTKLLAPPIPGPGENSKVGPPIGST